MLSERHTSKTWLRMKASFSIIVTNYRLKNIGYNAEKVYQPRHTAALSVGMGKQVQSEREIEMLVGLLTFLFSSHKGQVAKGESACGRSRETRRGFES
ncbi:hypothetical protein CDAR_256511 [Caerostris darwini]|uniref:Uncharacterized protein n=1 Tax=Caerostris darwini TaxID=1538125 RepID=A0AAV4PD72_9ARAC|nr:hypothetical protein CDAR_256511 [Caerostris darwini]